MIYSHKILQIQLASTKFEWCVTLSIHYSYSYLWLPPGENIINTIFFNKIWIVCDFEYTLLIYLFVTATWWDKQEQIVPIWSLSGLFTAVCLHEASCTVLYYPPPLPLNNLYKIQWMPLYFSKITKCSMSYLWKR